MVHIETDEDIQGDTHPELAWAASQMGSLPREWLQKTDQNSICSQVQTTHCIWGHQGREKECRATGSEREQGPQGCGKASQPQQCASPRYSCMGVHTGFQNPEQNWGTSGTHLETSHPEVYHDMKLTYATHSRMNSRKFLRIAIMLRLRGDRVQSVGPMLRNWGYSPSFRPPHCCPPETAEHRGTTD